MLVLCSISSLPLSFAVTSLQIYYKSSKMTGNWFHLNSIYVCEWFVKISPRSFDELIFDCIQSFFKSGPNWLSITYISFHFWLWSDVILALIKIFLFRFCDCTDEGLEDFPVTRGADGFEVRSAVCSSCSGGVAHLRHCNTTLRPNRNRRLVEYKNDCYFLSSQFTRVTTALWNFGKFQFCCCCCIKYITWYLERKFICLV